MECCAWAVQSVIVVADNISKGVTKTIFNFGCLWLQLHCVRVPCCMEGKHLSAKLKPKLEKNT